MSAVCVQMGRLGRPSSDAMSRPFAQRKVQEVLVATYTPLLVETGNLDKETQPFLWGDPEYQVDYAHDILGRVTQENRPISETQPSGAITMVTYAGLTTTVTAPGNPGTQTTVTLRDAIGRIVRVTDSLSGQTNYQYNAFDQLAVVSLVAELVGPGRGSGPAACSRSLRQA
jgi:YD repeat-containing protein